MKTSTTGKSTDILQSIVEHKHREVAQAKANIPAGDFELFPGFGRPVNSLRQALLAEGSTGIIAEFKRRSPSKGTINDLAAIREVTRGYVAAGAAGLSVLTDERFFGGTEADFHEARTGNTAAPLLRKEFIIDEYQLLEAKAWGADVVLLIAACLPPAELAELARLARSLGLEVLLEVHSREELDRCFGPDITLVGVNNRNLKTFGVSLDTSLQLAEHIPAQAVKISESGLSDPAALTTLRAAGYQGFLIGENFMKTPDPAAALRSFLAGQG